MVGTAQARLCPPYGTPRNAGWSADRWNGAGLRRFRCECQTADERPRSRGRACPRFACRCPPKNEGAGNAGCALHPRSRVQRVEKNCTRAYRAAENIRHPLRNGFTAYNALTPEYRALLASVAFRKMALGPGRAFAPPQDLMPTTEASGPHAFAVRFGTVRLHAYDGSRSLSRPAIHRAHDALASTAIPSQRSVTMANAPSSGTGCG